MTYSFNTRMLAILLALVLPLQFSFAQESDKDASESKETEKDNGKKTDKTKSYAEFITDKAVTDTGLFIVHKVDDKYYFEIPIKMLEREILVTSRVSGYVRNLSFGGAGMRTRPQQVVRWQEKDKKILLRSVSYNSVADESLPIYQSVRNNNFEPVIMAFSTLCYNADSSSVLIDVAPLFTTDVAKMLELAAYGSIKPESTEIQLAARVNLKQLRKDLSKGRKQRDMIAKQHCKDLRKTIKAVQKGKVTVPIMSSGSENAIHDETEILHGACWH